MLKDQLRGQNNALKNISEERDSYRTALQIMTKEINADEEKELPSQPEQDAEQGDWSIQQNKLHNRRSSRSTKSSPPGGGGYSQQWPIRGGSARKGYLFRLQVYKRVGILQVEVYKRLGKSVI